MDTVVNDKLAKLKKNYDEARSEIERAVKDDIGALCKKNRWNFCAQFQRPVTENAQSNCEVTYGADYDALMALWRWLGDQLGEEPRDAITGFCYVGEWTC